MVMEATAEGGFIDRSKVRILLCDNDSKSSQEVFNLLCKCSYQVTSVRSPRQVIDALNAEGPDIDIILSELDLPMAKGFKMLKYIMRDKALRRIPIIMMSAQDEVSIVVKCLKFGAADYLVKPLRTNELLNLWTHMWRRRRMLGLAEKNIISYDFDLVASDASDANTNSTTLFSDDTDDKSRKNANPSVCISTHHEIETNAAAPVQTQDVGSAECRPDVPGINDRKGGQIASFPKKSELRIGESSAFFTYVKSSMTKSNIPQASPIHENVPQNLRIEEKDNSSCQQMDTDTQQHINGNAQEIYLQGDNHPCSNSIPDSFSKERSCTPSICSRESPNMDFPQMHMIQRNESQHDVSGFHGRTGTHDSSGFHGHPAFPYYIPGVMNQMMMPSPPMYPNNMTDFHNHANSAMLPQFNHNSHCPPQMPGMASYPYYPVGFCVQTGQAPATHPWQSFGNSCSAEGTLSKVDRREAALIKFRQKRKERCFDKKIRYVNRKRLAERRPRVRGQFVRKINGVTVDLNGQPTLADDDDYDEEEDDEDEQAANVVVSLEDDA